MRIIFCALLLALGALPLVRALFMDMYGKAFQMELLDDCNIYVYDHVLESKGPTGWCKGSKSSMSHSIFNHRNDKTTRYFGFFCTYVDDHNILQMIHITDFHVKHYTLISQKFYEADIGHYSKVKENTNVKYTSTSTGKHFVQYFDTRNYFTIDYVSRKLKREVNYQMRKDVADVTRPVHDYHGLLYWVLNTTVRIDHNNTNARICTVDGKNSYTMHPIKKAIETICARYVEVINFTASFPQKFATQLPVPPAQPFAGVTKNKDGKLISSDQKIYDRPPIEKNYTEVPFFFYSESTGSYSPLFLYYKFDGPSRDFTVRFVYKGESYKIFEPLKYMEQCKFQDTVTVAAAPKILKHDEKAISFEVFFLLNNDNFQYCVFRVEFDFNTKNSTPSLSKTDDINAYVHVKSRSTTAVNCNFGNRTVRWLLAYTENKEAELVSLDDDVSSPIFPCSHCGSKTLMYCDVNPATVNKYYSAVYLVTDHELLYVGVKSTGTIKKIEYYNLKTEKKNYFLQELSFTLYLDDIFNQLNGGIGLPVPSSSPEPVENATVNGKPVENATVDGKPVENSPVDGTPVENAPVDGDETTACAPCYSWMTSVLLLILMTCILF